MQERSRTHLLSDLSKPLWYAKRCMLANEILSVDNVLNDMSAQQLQWRIYRGSRSHHVSDVLRCITLDVVQPAFTMLKRAEILVMSRFDEESGGRVVRWWEMIKEKLYVVWIHITAEW